MNHGEQDLEFFTKGFRKNNVVVQLADVGRVLISAAKVFQEGHEVKTDVQKIQ